MRRLTALLLATSFAVTLTAPMGAQAQLSSSSSGVSIAADRQEFKANQCLVRYSGDAEALQDDNRLRANTIQVFTKILGPQRSGENGPNCGDTDRMEADGDVYYVTPKQIVKADHAVYNADAKTVLFTGDVIVAQGKDVEAGTRLLIHTDTHDAEMQSNVTGRGKAGRVHAVIYPKSTTGQASGAGGAAATGLQAPKPPSPRPQGGV